MSAIVNNNTSNFLRRYGVNFHQNFKKELKLLEVKLIDKIFLIFAVNKSIISDCENTFTCESGVKVMYEYVINPKDVPVYDLLRYFMIETKFTWMKIYYLRRGMITKR